MRLTSSGERDQNSDKPWPVWVRKIGAALCFLGRERRSDRRAAIGRASVGLAGGVSADEPSMFPLNGPVTARLPERKPNEPRPEWAGIRKATNLAPIGLTKDERAKAAHLPPTNEAYAEYWCVGLGADGVPFSGLLLGDEALAMLEPGLDAIRELRMKEWVEANNEWGVYFAQGDSHVQPS